jgi:hypothetical protein
MTTYSKKHATDFVTTHMAEAIKTYSVWDMSGRLTDFYVALSDAPNGSQCMRTQYTYDGASTRVTKTNEVLALWDSAWDI